MSKKAVLIATAFVMFVLMIVPLAQALTFSSNYGVYSLATYNYNGSCCTYVQKPSGGAGDGSTGPVTAKGGSSDAYGDSGSSSATTDISTHTISGGASADCISSSVCYDNSGGSRGVGGSSEGDMYDTYSASCTGTCPALIDLEVVWTVTGSFLNAEDGTCAQSGCPPSYSAAGYYSEIFGQITFHRGGTTYAICPGYGFAHGCMAPIMDYLQGWNYCQGGGVPSDYCPYSSPSDAGSTFVYSGTVDLSSLIESSCGLSCNISPSNPVMLEFENSIFANSLVVPQSEGVTLTSSTFQVCTDTPGVTITSAASGVGASTCPTSTTTVTSTATITSTQTSTLLSSTTTTEESTSTAVSTIPTTVTSSTCYDPTATITVTSTVTVPVTVTSTTTFTTTEVVTTVETVYSTTVECLTTVTTPPHGVPEFALGGFASLFLLIVILVPILSLLRKRGLAAKR